LLLLNRPSQEAFKPAGHIMRFMDTWSLQEIENCRQRLHSDQPADDVIVRFDKWGGTARYILAKLNAVDQHAMEAAIATCPVKAMDDSLGAASAHVVNNRLIHMRVKPGTGFTETFIDWASPWVAERTRMSAGATSACNCKRL
jgi:hypothetical protein